MTYRSAVGAAITSGDLVRSVYDLYRRDLLTALGIAAAENPDDERGLWKALGQYLFRGANDSGAEESSKPVCVTCLATSRSHGIPRIRSAP